MGKKKVKANPLTIKRLMTEFKELKSDPPDLFHIEPIKNNLFEWHFTLKGNSNTSFEGGLFHGKLLLPLQYPYKAPDLIFLTPNGRFETDKKICLNITSFHNETWSPGWKIRTIMMAVIGFFPVRSNGIGSIDYSDAMRKKLSKKSMKWECKLCKMKNIEIFNKYMKNNNKEKPDDEIEKKKKGKVSKKKRKKKKKSKRVVFVEEDDSILQMIVNVVFCGIVVVLFFILFNLLKKK